MRLLILIVLAFMVYMAFQQYKIERNCLVWESHKVMSYDPVLKMVRPKNTKTCKEIDNGVQSEEDI